MLRKQLSFKKSWNKFWFWLIRKFIKSYELSYKKIIIIHLINTKSLQSLYIVITDWSMVLEILKFLKNNQYKYKSSLQINERRTHNGNWNPGHLAKTFTYSGNVTERCHLKVFHLFCVNRYLCLQKVNWYFTVVYLASG